MADSIGPTLEGAARMFKVNSHCLLVLTLVFSTAHAPTFMFWRTAAPTEELASGFSGTPATGRGGAYMPKLHREYAEDGEIKRFQLDDLYLPSLDVTLPELFNWSELDREYVADVDARIDEVAFDPDNSRGASIRLASLVSGPMFAGGHVGAGGASDGSSPGSADTSLVADAGDTSQTGKGGSTNEPMPGDDASSTGPSDSNGGGEGNSDTTPTTPGVLDPVDPNPDTVPVPAPSALGLIVLGLAGLQLAGRKKKQKRLAAS